MDISQHPVYKESVREFRKVKTQAYANIRVLTLELLKHQQKLLETQDEIIELLMSRNALKSGL